MAVKYTKVAAPTSSSQFFPIGLFAQADTLLTEISQQGYAMYPRIGTFVRRQSSAKNDSPAFHDTPSIELKKDAPDAADKFLRYESGNSNNQQPA